MPGPSDCLEGSLHFVSDAGMGIYWQPAATPDPIDDRLREQVGAMAEPGAVTVFVRGDVEIDPALRAYLHRDPRLLPDMRVKVVGDSAAESDVERSVANRLDLPVVSTRRVADRVAAGGTSSAHLVLPDVVNAQRQAAVDARDGRFASVGEFLTAFAGYRDALDADAVGIRAAPPTAWHALGVYLTKLHAASAPVPAAVTALFRRPVLSARQLVDALGGQENLREARPEALEAHLLENPGHFAVVVGDDQAYVLAPGESGGLTWTSPMESVPSRFDVDGAADRYTALLEHPDARVLVLDRSGTPRATPPLDQVRAAAPALINPPTHADIGPQGEIKIGAWPAKTGRGLGVDALDLRNVPTIMVDVRTPRSGGKPAERDAGRPAEPKNLDARLTNALHSAGFQHLLRDNRSMIIATDDVVEIRDAVGHGDVAIYPQPMRGLAETHQWFLRAPGAEPVLLGTGKLTQAMFDQGARVYGDLPRPNMRIPASLAEMLSRTSYAEAGEDWRTNFAELRSEPVGEALRRLVDDAPVANRGWVKVMAAVHRIARSTESFAHEAQPLEPTVRNWSGIEPSLPPGTTADVRFVFDYLAGRELSPAEPGTEAPSDYHARLLWDGLLFRMMLDGNLGGTEALALVEGLTADNRTRAVEVPKKLDALQTHAGIFAAVQKIEEKALAVVDGEAAGVDWTELTSLLAKCKDGTDRLPWHFRLRNMVRPHLEERGLLGRAEKALGELTDMIHRCH